MGKQNFTGSPALTSLSNKQEGIKLDSVVLLCSVFDPFLIRISFIKLRKHLFA